MQGPQGRAGPLNVDGKIYIKFRPKGTAPQDAYAASTAQCDPGDTLVGGGFEMTMDSGGSIRQLTSFGYHHNQAWEAVVLTDVPSAITSQAFCFNNP